MTTVIATASGRSARRAAGPQVWGRARRTVAVDASRVGNK